MNHLSLLSEQSVNKNQVVGGARTSALGSPMHCEHPLGASEKSITEIMSDASVDTGLQLDEDREKGDDGNSSHNDDEMLSGSSSAKKKRRPRNADDVPMSFPQKVRRLGSSETFVLCHYVCQPVNSHITDCMPLHDSISWLTQICFSLFLFLRWR